MWKNGLFFDISFKYQLHIFRQNGLFLGNIWRFTAKRGTFGCAICCFNVHIARKGRQNVSIFCNSRKAHFAKKKEFLQILGQKGRYLLEFEETGFYCCIKYLPSKILKISKVFCTQIKKKKWKICVKIRPLQAILSKKWQFLQVTRHFLQIPTPFFWVFW